jgi:hypothetical protein
MRLYSIWYIIIDLLLVYDFHFTGMHSIFRQALIAQNSSMEGERDHISYPSGYFPLLINDWRGKFLHRGFGREANA